MTGASEQEDQRSYNLAKSRFLVRLAWTIEIVLVGTGLAIAAAQAASLQALSQPASAVAIFGVFGILAVAELSKIPAATVAFHAKSWRRILPVIALIVASVISFETIFNGFERFVHLSTAPVREVQLQLRDLEAERSRLAEVALEAETDLAVIATLDAEHRSDLERAVASAQASYDAAIAGTESFETRELRTQLASAVEQQSLAVTRAGDDWDREQESIERRIRPDSGLDDATRRQLQARMRSMPARQTVTDAAAAPFIPTIEDLQARIEQSISAPSPEALERVANASRILKDAQDALATFQAEAAVNQRERVAQARQDIASARLRAAEIERIESDIAATERKVAEAAVASQMHRWASFIFRVEPVEVADDQAKAVGAAFGALLAVATALAGSVTAMFAEWFRVRGVQPVTVEVPVEVPVEVKVPVEVEVPVETIRFVYVPLPADLPAGEDVEASIERILVELPPHVAADLRRQIRADSVVPLRKEGTSDAA